MIGISSVKIPIRLKRRITKAELASARKDLVSHIDVAHSPLGTLLTGHGFLCCKSRRHLFV